MYARSVACAALSGQPNDVRAELREQLVALLVLVADARRETAQDLAGLLLDLFTKTVDTAARKLKRSDLALFASVGERARAEREAGSLDGLVRRNRLLWRRDPTELADFLDFADQYRTLPHDRTSELAPAYFDVQRRVPTDRLYVQPRFAHERGAASLDALLARTFRTVILGDPGAGKSTLAQHLAHVYSAPRTGEFGVVPFVVTPRTYEEWKKTEHGSVVEFIATHIVENFHPLVRRRPAAGRPLGGPELGEQREVTHETCGSPSSSSPDRPDDQCELVIDQPRVLEPVFVARSTGDSWKVEISEALTSSGLSGERRKVLATWAGRRTHFTSA